MRDGYVPNLKAPGKRGPSRLMWLTVVLCILLPPVGLVMLWGGVRCPLRGKVLLTILSALLMTLALTLFLQTQTAPAHPLVVPSPTVQMYGQATPAPLPTPVPAPDSPAPAPGNPDADPSVESQVPPAETALPQGVIPANPMG